MWVTAYGKTHVAYLILIGIGCVGVHAWIGEHDARLLAEQQVKSAAVALKSSQDAIKGLQEQIAATDAQTASQIASLTKALQTVKTPQQVVTALPTVAPNLPTPAAVQTDNSLTFPAADVLPLFQDLADGKTAEVKLTQCQSDYTAEQQIVSQQTDQLKQKDATIAVLKKPAGFWHRVTGTLKAVGIGIGIGATIAKL